MKKTKIIATIGPASRSKTMLTDMVKAGMNVARLNFSHGTHESHSETMENIRSVSKKLKLPIAIMQDLQGPKIRVAEMTQPLSVKTGDKVVIGKDFDVDFDISTSVKPKEAILIEDGLIELIVNKVVKSKSKKTHGLIHCTVVSPGTIRSHKGMNLPDSKITFPILTKKDIKDLKFGLESDVDYIALSFVRNEKDIINLRKLIKKHNPKGFEEPQIIAKIERGEAVECFSKILHEVDAVMVARGDLGVELPDSQVPLIQKRLIRECVMHAKPVIVATQMLDSMIRNPRPTRAEVSDVANAVIDHADAVMLSGETAHGKYPLKSVSEMNRIVLAAEQSPLSQDPCTYIGREDDGTRASMIAEAVTKLAVGIGAQKIIGTTESGFTARYVSHHRPQAPILILTDKPKVRRQMALLWGVRPLYVDSLSALKSVEGLLKYFVSKTKRLKLVAKGDKVVMVAGNPLGRRMNLVQVINVD